MAATARFNDPTLPDSPALYLAFALSNRSRKLAFSSGLGQKPRIRSIPARDPQAKDARNLHLELLTLKSDRTRITNRIKGLLAAQGLSAPSPARGFPNQLDDLRLWDGTPLCPELRQRLEPEWLHRCYVSDRIRHIEKIQTERLEASDDPAFALVRQLMTLKGVGLQSAWLFTFEFFAWRNIQNRRQLAALCGFTPTPYQSGDESLDQGISKAGSSLVRAMTIQIAWRWLHFQPDSALTLWFQRRFANGGRRMRAIGIVAVARRLLIELWRFIENGSLPEGAVTSPP